ncbi:DUF1330 domain-containing protein [Thalassotalea piscium]
MSAYLIIQAKLSDWNKFKDYTEVVPAIVKQYGGEYIVMDSQPEIFEGEDAGSVVVSKWPSKEAAQNFWQSSEYKKAKPLRAGTGKFHVMLVNSL